jgi:hypothetical protein
MSVEPGRIPAPDRALKKLKWARVIASKQAVSVYTVVFTGGDRHELELTEAQAEGFECLTCKSECATGSGAFRPVGKINGFNSVFRCVACIERGDV